jgi:hypothetical protein
MLRGTITSNGRFNVECLVCDVVIRPGRGCQHFFVDGFERLWRWASWAHDVDWEEGMPPPAVRLEVRG